MSNSVTRCKWSEGVSPAYIEYHDNEWGVPVRDDRKQFEFLVLEGAQAGLSWSTILNKRDGYRRLFAQFDPEKVARFIGLDFAYLPEDAPAAEKDCCRIVFDVSEMVMNPQGTLHGGIMATVMDISMGHLVKQVAGAGAGRRCRRCGS